MVKIKRSLLNRISLYAFHKFTMVPTGSKREWFWNWLSHAAANASARQARRRLK